MQGQKGASNEKVWFQGVARRIVCRIFGGETSGMELSHFITVCYKNERLGDAKIISGAQFWPFWKGFPLTKCRNAVNSHVGAKDFRDKYGTV